MMTFEFDLWPAWCCEHCGVQERGRMLWFLNHGTCRWKAGHEPHSISSSPLD